MQIIRNNTYQIFLRFESISVGDTFEYGGKLYIKIPRVVDGSNAERFDVDGMGKAYFQPGDLCALVDVMVSYSYRPQSGEEESE